MAHGQPQRLAEDVLAWPAPGFSQPSCSGTNRGTNGTARVQQLLPSSANLTFPLQPAFLLSFLSASVLFLLSSTLYFWKWAYAHLHFGIPLNCWETCLKSLIFHVSGDCPIPSAVSHSQVLGVITDGGKKNVCLEIATSLLQYTVIQHR